jgi:hypothetical protein
VKPSTKSPKLLDTFLRALERLAELAPEVQELEDELAEREGEILEKILALLKPVLPRLAAPIPFREPWLDGDGAGAAMLGERRFRDGLVLARKFQRDARDGRLHHRSTEIVLDVEGCLFEIDQTASWREGGDGPRDGIWRIESHEVAPTPAFARENLRRILTTLFETLRERLKREVDRKNDVLERLAVIEDAVKVLDRKPD